MLLSFSLDSSLALRWQVFQNSTRGWGFTGIPRGKPTICRLLKDLSTYKGRRAMPQGSSVHKECSRCKMVLPVNLYSLCSHVWSITAGTKENIPSTNKLHLRPFCKSFIRRYCGLPSWIAITYRRCGEHQPLGNWVTSIWPTLRTAEYR